MCSYIISSNVLILLIYFNREVIEMIKSKRITVIIFIVSLILIILMLFNKSNKDLIIFFYNSDVNTFQQNYEEFVNELNTFDKSPNLSNYSELQYKYGRTIALLGPLDRSMSLCYKAGLLSDKNTDYRNSDVTVFVGRLIKDSMKSLEKSITIIDGKLVVDNNKVNLVIESVKSGNDLIKPFYDVFE